MTDKEKRELKEGVISIFKSFNILDHTATIGGLRDDILECINSMQEKPVSEDLKNAADDALESISDQYDIISVGSCLEMFRLGARWQKQQMMKDATDATVHIEAGNYPYIPQIELYDYDNDVPLAKEGDKYKVVLVKGE
jgi:hypothetical protein